jgi:hypothetical protein
MSVYKKLALIPALLFCSALWSSARAQMPALDVAIDTDQVRFAAAAQEMRVEVYAPSGEMIFDSGAVTDQSVEWKMQDAQGERVADGVYLVTIQLKSATGQIRKRIEQVSVGRDMQERRAAQTSPNAAQATITGVGTSGRIAKFTGGSTIGNSIITEGSGRIGIGTTSPTEAKLQVVGGSNNHGIYGSSSCSNCTGVIGVSNNGVVSAGVSGTSTSGYGVIGQSTNGLGVLGSSHNSDGVAGSSSYHNGVYGENTSSVSYAGVNGFSLYTNGNGVIGEANRGTLAYGVWGKSTQGKAVIGTSTSGYGVQGQSSSNFGVYGYSSSGYGVVGQTSSTNGSTGVSGSSNASNGTGVIGQANSGADAIGVWGTSTSGTGVYGYTNSASGAGVSGFSNIGSTGVVGEANGEGSYGVWGKSDGGYAGYFDGNVFATGTITSGAGALKIDHPLDPAHKYLSHAIVESPEMMNIYSGNVVTNENGEAVVTLPHYFQALNRDFRYQLTVIGEFAQAIVSSKIRGNRFQIKTDRPNIEVSWQVTGIRKDAYAEAHPVTVEEDKPEKEQGFYLHPELYKQSEEKGVEWARRPEQTRQQKVRGTRQPPEIPQGSEVKQ